MKFKILLVLLSVFLSTFVFSNVYASNIVDIEVENVKKVNLILTEDVQLSDSNVNWNIKILKDLSIQSVTKVNDKKINIMLLEDLKVNTNYSLFSVLWLDWNIDFKTDNLLENVEKINSDVPSLQWIVKVNILNSSWILI